MVLLSHRLRTLPRLLISMVSLSMILLTSTENQSERPLPASPHQVKVMEEAAIGGEYRGKKMISTVYLVCVCENNHYYY